MPKREDIKKVLVIGSGPIIIGQAAEFDYAGVQCCRALREEGIEIVLLNSNPATIMTDKHLADAIYLEPLTTDTIKRIVEIEKPDSILPTFGGQTALNLAMELAREGYFDEHPVRLLSANPAVIKKAEDRQAFKDMLTEIGEPFIESEMVNNIQDAIAFVAKVGYPVIVRPAYTLGGSGGGIVCNEEELKDIGQNGLRLSPTTEILVEKCISGWKEIEYEVMRDSKGNVITVCAMENIDPVGIHTGDSIVVAPTQTLADKEYQMLRSAALNIIGALEIEGGCNVQFALHPDSYRYAVIEVNPRVSRSSALASKATGYPIAKVATKIAVGYGLDEIMNAVTGKTYAFFEPVLDYCVIKFPKFPFDKFVYAKRKLGTQMKATGEIMSIGMSMEEALMKGVRSIELGLDTLRMNEYAKLPLRKIREKIEEEDDTRIFAVYEALYRGITVESLHAITNIDPFFLHSLLNLARMEAKIQFEEVTEELYRTAKKMGFLDSTLQRLSDQDLPARLFASYKTVDTCAAEFDAETPYYYSTFDEVSEAPKSTGRKILTIGSGPIRIGQGIEFDYCSVQAVWALRDLGYETIIANNNPETVSTDFDIAHRLYFDPLTPEDIDNLLKAEEPEGAIVQFGGQTAINLAKHLKKRNIPILGTAQEMIDAAEDREKFDAILEKCGIKRPEGKMVYTMEKALDAAETLGYPVLLRPSYVLGGQNMIIAYTAYDVEEYMGIILRNFIENPVLVDKYLMGKEVEVDAICDGKDILIPGIMEHVERAGVHSGDSISIYPAQTVSDKHKAKIIEYTELLAKELEVLGLINIQFIIAHDEVFVIEVNPRSSRTVPYISKVTGIPMVQLAIRCIMGEALKDMGFGTGLYRESGKIAVKVPVFSFEKLHNVDTLLGPEMKSTGEVLGIADCLDEALLKGFVAAGFAIKNKGKALLSVRDKDKNDLLEVAEGFRSLGFHLYATKGTAGFLAEHDIEATPVNKIREGSPHILDLVGQREFDYIVNTSTFSRASSQDSLKIRRKAVEASIPCMTSLDTANALLKCPKADKNLQNIALIDINKLN